MGAPLPEQLILPLSELLAARIGLHFPRERWRDLERGLAAVAPVFGAADAAACARRLLDAPPTRREIEALAAHLTVGETYFFREKSSFEALEQHILPPLIHRRAQTDRHLRLWSAGCSTGEEPYSLAMLLDRLLPDIDEWRITLLATDINPLSLRKAAEGIYGEWSFRGTPDWLRARYFRRRDDGRYELLPSVRRRVTFSYLNLAEDTYPSLTTHTNAMDVILCRNVLMYFSPPWMKEAAARLTRSLVEGGWLIVSPTETANALFHPLRAVEFPGVIVYHRHDGAEAPAAVIGHRRPPPAVRAEIDVPPPVADAAPPVSPVRAPPPAAADVRPQAGHGASLIDAARECANRGRLDEALAWCERAIGADKLNPAYHYLLAVIQRELGRNAAAARSLERVLYLEPDFVLAHFALGNLRLAEARYREARRHFDNALALLRTRPHDEPLPAAEGLTAGRLGEIVASIHMSLPRTTAGASFRRTAGDD